MRKQLNCCCLAPTSEGQAASFQAPYAIPSEFRSLNTLHSKMSCSDTMKEHCCSPEPAKHTYTFVHIDPRCTTVWCKGWPGPCTAVWQGDHISILRLCTDCHWSWTCLFVEFLLWVAIRPLYLFSVWCRAN